MKFIRDKSEIIDILYKDYQHYIFKLDRKIKNKLSKIYGELI